MKRGLASTIVLRGAMVSAVLTAGALAACSLGLKSEDSYFTGIDAAAGDDNGLRAEASVPREASASPDGTTTPMGDDSVADAGASQPEAASDEASADAGMGDAAFDPDVLEPATLQVYYSFDQEGGAPPGTVLDQSGNHIDGLLFGGVDGGNALPVFDPLGHKGKGLKLDGAQLQYVQLPSRVLQGFDAMSVSCWINIATPQVWDRLFDFNDGDHIWMYFSPTGWNPTTTLPGTHFAISDGVLDPEMILTETVSPGQWHHVVVVLDRPNYFYYLDGVEKSHMTNMTETPNDLNAVENWLGRSSYAADPYLSATIDEFRLYSGGLKPVEVQQLFSE